MMWIADGWKDYEVLDCSSGEKLERWGEYFLVRPDPQVIWSTERADARWRKNHGHYHRSNKGGGEWEFHGLPDEWAISYPLSIGKNLTFRLKPFAFKHTGVFPEQAVNWEWMSRKIAEETARRKSLPGCTDAPDSGDRRQSRSVPSHPVRVLNLFAYTGGATLACAAAGAQVVHVDASKGMVSWAKENAASSGLSDAPVRWLVDDCVKFVERELRRGNRYDGIVMDPPSYGRGPKGEIWKIEENLWSLVTLAAQLLSEDALFFLINSYTTGLQPGVLQYMLTSAVLDAPGNSGKIRGGTVRAQEIGLPVSRGGSLALPCGASGRWERA